MTLILKWLIYCETSQNTSCFHKDFSYKYKKSRIIRIPSSYFAHIAKSIHNFVFDFGKTPIVGRVRWISVFIEYVSKSLRSKNHYPQKERQISHALVRYCFSFELRNIKCMLYRNREISYIWNPTSYLLFSG